MLSDCTWGIIFLDPDSELTLGDFSPKLVEVRLSKGSAAFRSRKKTHFTIPVKIEKVGGDEWWNYHPKAVVTGLDTEFAITAGDEIEVHCLEGKLVVDIPNATESLLSQKTTSGGQLKMTDMSGTHMVMSHTCTLRT
jgi:ferric-dicitrate binding protein FerR (iron transport regulator)